MLSRVLQAEKLSDANQTAIISPESVPSAVQWIHATGMVKGVAFTWVILSSDSEVSVNLRYLCESTVSDSSPPVSITATALTKSSGKAVTWKGSTTLNAGWISPLSLEIPMSGDSSLYEASSLDVVASPLVTSPSPSLPSTAPKSNDNKITPPAVTPESGVLEVLSSNSFIDSIGNLHLVGEIENGTPDHATYVKATATFYDKNNNVVATDYSFTSPTDLGPRNKAPFEIIVTSASIPVNQIDPYGIIASSQ